MINTIYKSNFIYFLFFLNQISSVRYFLNSSTFDKNINFFYAYLFLSCVIFYFIMQKKIIDFFLHDYFFYTLLLIFCIFLLKFYPIQENLKLMMQGSDQDNCYVDILKNFLNREKFIYSTSYLGNPCSTGLLSFLFYFPLFFWEGYFAIVPIIFIILFKQSNLNLLNDNKSSNLLSLILLSNLVFLELSVSGSDFISISISYVAANIFLIDGFKKDNNIKVLFAFFLFLFFFGSRSIFLILIFPLAFVYFIKFEKKKVLFFFLPLTILTFTSFFLPYYLIMPDFFPPFHLIGKTFWYLNNIKYFLIFLFFLSFFFKNLILKIIVSNFLLSILLILMIPLSLGGISGFVYNINDLSKWEELNYIFIFTPSLLIFVTAIRNFKLK